jgi:ABC-type antimicrobial peptide transport system permease subunit
VQTVLGHGLALMIGGVILGTAGAWATTRLPQTLLFGVTPGDPATFGSVLLILGLVGIIACAAPAVRAMRLDPIEVLRQD